jgi:hypothetical protein
LFNATYQSTRIFDDTPPKGLALAPLPAGRQQVKVSVPDRALLELFSDTGNQPHSGAHVGAWFDRHCAISVFRSAFCDQPP